MPEERFLLRSLSSIWWLWPSVRSYLTCRTPAAVTSVMTKPFDGRVSLAHHFLTTSNPGNEFLKFSLFRTKWSRNRPICSCRVKLRYVPPVDKFADKAFSRSRKRFCTLAAVVHLVRSGLTCQEGRILPSLASCL